MNNHSYAFENIKMYYQDWKMMTAEIVKSLVPFSITQAECDEILGVKQKPAAQPTTNQNENTQAPSPATN